jgi:hypothetical protein
MVESPLYVRWAKFPVGTSIVTKMESEIGPNKTVTTTSYKLTELTDNHLIVEMKAYTVRYDGTIVDNPPEKLRNIRWINLPEGIKKEDFGKPTGVILNQNERITVGDKEYRSTCYKIKAQTEAGESEGKVWYSTEVPGELLKSVSHVDAAKFKSTVELIEIKIPSE